MTTDPIADMLTRIRNAALIGSDSVVIPYSKIKHSIAKILLSQHFVEDVKVDKNGAFQSLVLKLGGNEDTRKITKLLRVSKPGRRIYAKKTELPRVLSGRGIVIVSTSAGLMTGQDARKRGLGGELICKVW